MNVRLFFFLACCAMGWLACANPQDGALSAETRTELDELALQDRPTEEKYHVMGSKLALVLEEAAAKSTNQAAMDHLNEFEVENRWALQELHHEVNQWQRQIDDETRNLFIMRVLAQEYSATFGSLIPRFRRRIRGNQRHESEFERLFGYLDFRK